MVSTGVKLGQWPIITPTWSDFSGVILGNTEKAPILSHICTAWTGEFIVTSSVRGWLRVRLANQGHFFRDGWQGCSKGSEEEQISILYPTKSILTPTQRITFLGFAIDSAQMTLEITEEKKSKIHWNLMNVMKLQKKSGFGVLVETYTLVQHTFQAKKIWYKYYLKCRI